MICRTARRPALPIHGLTQQYHSVPDLTVTNHNRSYRYDTETNLSVRYQNQTHLSCPAPKRNNIVQQYATARHYLTLSGIAIPIRNQTERNSSLPSITTTMLRPVLHYLSQPVLTLPLRYRTAAELNRVEPYFTSPVRQLTWVNYTIPTPTCSVCCNTTHYQNLTLSCYSKLDYTAPYHDIIPR